MHAGNLIPCPIDNVRPMSGYGQRQDNPGSSCKALKAVRGSSAVSGLYWVQPTATALVSRVYCDLQVTV